MTKSKKKKEKKGKRRKKRLKSSARFSSGFLMSLTSHKMPLVKEKIFSKRPIFLLTVQSF